MVAASERAHEPVLVDAVERLLAPQAGQCVLDATVGLGGHAARLVRMITPGGRYIGLDIDPHMVEQARRRLEPLLPESVTLDLSVANYINWGDVLDTHGLSRVDLVLADLGINSAQLDDASRGFSIEADGPLDMRFDRSARERAIDLVNGLSESALADLFYEYGQEGQSRKIARQICQARRARRITTTRELAAVVESALERPAGRRRTHPATRVFQALRIAVNHELDNLRAFLAQVPERLNRGGRLAVISFHSLEDAIVKRFLREQKAAGTLRELTKRPVGPEAGEVRANPRSRSAKLRVAERT